jgi:protease-4
MTMKRTLWTAIASLLVFGAGVRPAAAQTALPGDPEERPTRSLYIAGAGRAGDADASGVELNPAQLGLLPASNLELVLDGWHGSPAVPSRGVGLFGATPIVWSSALGFGLSHVGEADSAGVVSHTVLQLAYALRLGRAAALGVTWNHIWGSSFAGSNTFDVGLSARFGRFAAIGLVLEDANTPTPNPTPLVPLPAALPRLWAGELLLRPLGTSRLEVAAGAAHAEGDRWKAVAVDTRLTALLGPGVRVYGQFQTLPEGTAFAFGNGAVYRVGAGLMLDFDHVVAVVGMRAGTAGSAGAGAGAAGVLRVDGERHANILRPTVVARVSLEGIDSDREFLELLRRLRALGAEPGVVGVLLKIENMDLGLGRIEELRDAVARLRAHGKLVYAYAPFYSTREYYLAAACNAIIIHPAGELSLTGFAQTVTFYKKAMDRLGVNLELVRIGEYKGAMEPFVMTEQSAPVRANKNDILDHTFGRMVAAVATARSRPGRVLDDAEVRALVDRGLFTPIEGQLAGLIDAAKGEEELEEYLRQTTRQPGLSLRDADTSPVHPRAWPSRRVAVVLVDGAITDGHSRRLPFDLGTFAGSDTLVAALQACQQDASVGAVVLRVNSPGGSAFASDVIARAILQLRKVHKPVIVSMGDTAASGGYYISAPADLIYAEPSTITGSIGIFGYKVDVQKLLAMLGVTTETYRRGTHADYQSSDRPWTPEEIRMVAEKIRHFYGLFLNIVAEGRRSRGLTLARVDEIGRGHIWTGGEALGLGLVDRMGGVSDAIDEAARLSGAPLGRDGQPDVAVLPPPSSGLAERLLGTGAGDDDHTATGAGAEGLLKMSGAAPAVRLLAPLVAGGNIGIQAGIPYDLEIR